MKSRFLQGCAPSEGSRKASSLASSSLLVAPGNPSLVCRYVTAVSASMVTWPFSLRVSVSISPNPYKDTVVRFRTPCPIRYELILT